MARCFGFWEKGVDAARTVWSIGGGGAGAISPEPPTRGKLERYAAPSNIRLGVAKGEGAHADIQRDGSNWLLGVTPIATPVKQKQPAHATHRSNRPQQATTSQHEPSSTAVPGPIPPSRCPYLHGTAGVGPYPGYVHGKHAAICKNGCVPDPLVGRDGREGETWKETLVREAVEYQELYHKEMGSSEEVKTARVNEILSQIGRTGTYTHTYDELQHGARVAWRNAPKCSNRKIAMELNLIDKRAAKTPEDMMAACLELLEMATLSCITTANIVVFRPQTPGTQDGPRVWNNQLIRFACYENAAGELVGDPAEKDFTRMCRTCLGWQAPPPDKRTRWDTLPLVLQAHPSQPPQVFDVPPHYVPRVHITHPEYPQFASLGLQWYAVPAVSNMDLTVGGILYTACPFNGWYATTEIVRNLTDESRYNMCLPVAKKLGLNTKGDDAMWRDKAMVEITTAVMHSFKEAGMGMVNHHTLIRTFFGWYNKEIAERGYCPGNWKWIIPPVSPSLSRAYLELNHMTEYTLKPAYLYGAGWRNQLKRLQVELPGFRVVQPPLFKCGTMTRVTPNKGAGFACSSKVVIIYASVTGNTQRHAEQVAIVVAGGAQVTLLNVEDFEPHCWADAITAAKFVLLMSSTHGAGAPPTSATKFMVWCEKADGKQVLAGKPFAMLGLGNSCYPRFCAAADILSALMQAAGATPLIPVAKADVLGAEELVVWECVRSLCEAAAATDQQLMDEAARAAIIEKIPVSAQGQVLREFQPRFVLAKLGRPEGMVVPRDRLRVPARVLESIELLKSPEDRQATRLLRLDVNTAGISLPYLTGDSVAIYGQNPPELVETFAKAAGISDLDELFLLQDLEVALDQEGSNRSLISYPMPNTFRNVLTEYVALAAPLSFEAMSALLNYAPDDDHLRSMAGSFKDFKEWCSQVGARFCDVFDLFPALTGQLPLAAFLQLCPAITPRHYSISSSLATHPGELHVTVGRLAYTLPSGAPRDGFCSSFLTSRQPGDIVHLKVSPTPGFRMPLDVTAPVIMVAAGTGIAPFKGFWEERRARRQYLGEDGVLGPAALLFGCRSPDQDHLYQELLREAVASGVLSHVLVAYSRHKTQQKMYVQDLVAKHSNELKSLLRHPHCHVYVCGSSNMAQDVAVAFGRVMGTKQHNTMVQEGRYHEDVYGMQVDPAAAMKQAASSVQGTQVKALSKLPMSELLARLEAQPDIVSARDENGDTLLHLAALDGNVPLLATLASKLPGSLNIVDFYGRTPLQCAQLAGNTEAATILKAMGAGLVSSLHASFYLLHSAALTGNLAELQQQIAAGADVNQADYSGLAPLHIAAVRGDEQMVDLLIQAGAALNATNRRGMSALQMAVILQHPGVADRLRAAGASLVVKPITAASAAAGKEAWDVTGGALLEEVAGISQEEVAALQAAWALVSSESRPQEVQESLEKVGVDLFLSLFQQYPNMLKLFPFKDEQGRPIIGELKVHGLKVVSTLGAVLDKLSNVNALVRYTEDLVERHIKYGVKMVHYDIVLGVLGQYLQQQLMAAGTWDTLQASAWGKLLALIRNMAARYYQSSPGIALNVQSYSENGAIGH